MILDYYKKNDNNINDNHLIKKLRVKTNLKISDNLFTYRCMLYMENSIQICQQWGTLLCINIRKTTKPNLFATSCNV